MKNNASNQITGLLRKYVEPLPENGLGITEVWTWQPSKKIELKNLENASPTTEYSTENGEN